MRSSSVPGSSSDVVSLPIVYRRRLVQCRAGSQGARKTLIGARPPSADRRGCPRGAAVAWCEWREKEVVRIGDERALEVGWDRNGDAAFGHDLQARVLHLGHQGV